MSRISDLVRDSKLFTEFTAEYTTHTFYGSRLDLGKRRARRQRREERWTKSKRLGHGSFGVVWLEECATRENGSLRAVKEIKKETVGFKEEEYNRELEAIMKFSHDRYDDFFVRSYGWFENSKSVFIAMEYIRHGDLQQYLTQPLAETEAKQIVCQILEGLECMHDNGFAHRDLKPKNIFVVTRGPDWWVKIGDFGISKRVERGKTVLRTINGTPGYIAPEILEQMFEVDEVHEFGYTFAVDVWSLGVIAFYILTKKLPFPRNNDLLKYARRDSSMAMICSSENQLSQEATSFLTCIMAAKPQDRVTAKEALNQIWLQSVQQELPHDSPENSVKAPSVSGMSGLALSDSSSESEAGLATWTTTVRSRSSSRILDPAPYKRVTRVSRSRSKESARLPEVPLKEEKPPSRDAGQSPGPSQVRDSSDSYIGYQSHKASPPDSSSKWEGQKYTHCKCTMVSPTGRGMIRMKKDLIRPEVLQAYGARFHVRNRCIYIEGEILKETVDFYISETLNYMHDKSWKPLSNEEPSWTREEAPSSSPPRGRRQSSASYYERSPGPIDEIRLPPPPSPSPQARRKSSAPYHERSPRPIDETPLAPPPSPPPRARRKSLAPYHDKPKADVESTTRRGPKKEVRFSPHAIILEGSGRTRERITSRASAESDSGLSSWNILNESEPDSEEELEWNRPNWDTQAHSGLETQGESSSNESSIYSRLRFWSQR